MWLGCPTIRRSISWSDPTETDGVPCAAPAGRYNHRLPAGGGRRMRTPAASAPVRQLPQLQQLPRLPQLPRVAPERVGGATGACKFLATGATAVLRSINFAREEAPWRSC